MYTNINKLSKYTWNNKLIYKYKYESENYLEYN